MFGKKDDQVGTRGQRIRGEWGATVDHAKRAAGQAAGGVGDAVRPRVATLRDRMAPARAKRSHTPRRWPVLTGLAAAGAAVGVVGAVLLRRRRPAWDSAELEAPVEESAPVTESA